MLIAVDCGNTNVVVGIHDGSRWQGEFRLATDLSLDTESYAALLLKGFGEQQIALASIDVVVLGTVVAPLSLVLRKAFVSLGIGPFLQAGFELSWPMPIEVEEPSLVGADRLLNSYAAWRLFGEPSIVVDCGTATTFDVTSQTGTFIGGAIAPGLIACRDALYKSVSVALPAVQFEPPSQVIAKNTKEAIQSGLFLGYIGLIDALIARSQAELPYKARVIATGGLSEKVKGLCATIDTWMPHLTLEGLRLLYEDHSSKEK